MANDDSRDAGTAEREDSRQQGVELGALDEELETHDYPATSADLVAAYGDFEIDLPGGSQHLADVLGILDQNDEQFAGPEEARQAIYNLVGSEAVGRDNYTDRGGTTPDEVDDGDDESL
ncbi:DUF5789 family protein [Halobacterium bonnevillei]|uniref:DUF2795 domain-containing protein n=1 Tax=Halobacterium bonnevillei TaxID=2692200 RepID=A0A6B0SI82_9EURY|nr:hypothetical protein [Halobacterium bonnevillei]MXR20807.1 hypothetical protein [Halobacterium bonnevillei]